MLVRSFLARKAGCDADEVAAGCAAASASVPALRSAVQARRKRRLRGRLNVALVSHQRRRGSSHSDVVLIILFAIPLYLKKIPFIVQFKKIQF